MLDVMDRRLTSSSKAAPRAAILGLLFLAAPWVRAAGPAPELLPPALSAQLEDLRLPEAAARLSTLLGAPVRLAEEDPTADAPRLDRDRRARLTWTNVPTGDALREFCRAYGCRLGYSAPEGYTVLPGPLPAGPSLTVNGFRLEITHLGFADGRILGESAADLTVRRTLDLGFAVRAPGAEVERVCCLENVRVVDSHGRDVRNRALDPGAAPVLRPLTTGPFPDERLQAVSLNWPYPAPQRLQTIEGELVLYRSVRPARVEIPLPRAGEAAAPRDVGDVQLQVLQAQTTENGLRVAARFLCPDAVHLQLAEHRPAVTALLEDGTRAALRVETSSWRHGPGVRRIEQTLTGVGLRSRPVKVAWDLLLKSEPDRRTPFRFTDYPAAFSPSASVSPAAETARPAPEGSR